MLSHRGTKYTRFALPLTPFAGRSGKPRTPFPPLGPSPGYADRALLGAVDAALKTSMARRAARSFNAHTLLHLHRRLD
jgi:hypothetical protein